MWLKVTLPDNEKAWDPTQICAPKKPHRCHVTCCLSKQSEGCPVEGQAQLGGPHCGGLCKEGLPPPGSLMCVTSLHHPPLPWVTLTFVLSMHSPLLVIFQGVFVYLTAKSFIVSSRGSRVVAFPALSMGSAAVASGQPPASEGL